MSAAGHIFLFLVVRLCLCYGWLCAKLVAHASWCANRLTTNLHEGKATQKKEHELITPLLGSSSGLSISNYHARRHFSEVLVFFRFFKPYEPHLYPPPVFAIIYTTQILPLAPGVPPPINYSSSRKRSHTTPRTAPCERFVHHTTASRVLGILRHLFTVSGIDYTSKQANNNKKESSDPLKTSIPCAITFNETRHILQPQQQRQKVHQKHTFSSLLLAIHCFPR